MQLVKENASSGIIGNRLADLGVIVTDAQVNAYLKILGVVRVRNSNRKTYVAV